ncbi:MAG: SDR family oxidoreductase, partial [Eubacterium callanderi]
KSEAFLQGYSAQCPMSRPGKRGEVSGPVLFFSSDASSYVTGQHIVVDGGTSIV